MTLVPSKQRDKGERIDPGDPSDVEDVNTKWDKHTKTLQMTRCLILSGLHGSRTGGPMAVVPPPAPPDFLGPMRISGANLRLISAEWKWQRGCSEPPVVNGTLPFLL